MASKGVTSIQKVESDQLNLFPNPTDGLFSFSIDKQIIENVRISNMNGKLLKNCKSMDKGFIDLSDHPNGFIYLRPNI